MLNFRKNFSVAILMLAISLLVGCANYKTIEVPEVVEDDRSAEIIKCEEIMHGEWTDRPFVYVYENSNEEGEWRPITNLVKDAEEYIAKGTHVYISFDQWRGKDVKAVTVEYNPSYFGSSVDEDKLDYYCFDGEGNTIETHSNSDEPPYQVDSYQDLIEHLQLPAEVNEGPSLERIDLNELIENSDFQEDEYLQFVSKDRNLFFNYRPDWICDEAVSNFRVDCYPKYRMEQIRKSGLPGEIVFPEISIINHNCQLDSGKNAGDVILNTSDFEGVKYNTFYKEYNNCEVSISAYSEIDTGEELSKIIIE